MLNTVNHVRMRGEEISVPDMAASFQQRITDILAEKLCWRPVTWARKICLAGGVGANLALRQKLEKGARRLSAQLYLPELKLCGDNAAMVAAQGYYEYLDRNVADLSLNGLPTLNIDYR